MVVSPGKKKLLTVMAVGVLSLLHVALVFRHFPVSSVRDGNPLCSGDLNWHFACGAEGDQFIRQQGRIWGYSPTFMAGYPYGMWNSFSKRGHEFATTLLSGTSVETAYYLWLVLTAVSVPFLVALACRVLGGSWGMTGLCLSISIVVYQFGSIVTYFWTFGNVVFPFVTALCILYTAILYRSLVTSGPSPGDKGLVVRSLWSCSRPTVAGLLLGAIFWLQPLCLFPAGFATIAVMIESRQKLRSVRGWLMLLVIGAIALVVSWPWLSALLQVLDVRIDSPPGLVGSVKHLVMDVFSDRGYRQPYDRRSLYHVLVVLACIGVSRPSRSRSSGSLALALAAFGSLICTYGFSYSSLLQNTQPYRYLVSVVLFLVVPASYGLTVAWAWFKEAGAAGRRLAIALMVVLLPCLFGYAFDAVGREPASGLSSDQLSVVKWLQEQGDVEGRVICEDGVLGNMLPHLAGVDVIGGNFSGPPLLHSWASVGLNRFLRVGQPEGIPLEVMRSYLELYNVRIVVAVTPGLQASIAQQRGVTRVDGEFGSFAVFELQSWPGGWIVGADAGENMTVEAGANRLRIRGAPPGKWVLKYHHVPLLRAASASVSIEPQFQLADPIPFIMVNNAAAEDDVEIVFGK